MGRIDGKVAIMCGGARGQWAAEARLFARDGARVVCGDTLDEEGRAAAEIRQGGGEATYIHLDVTREQDWRAAVETAVNSYGRLDILVITPGSSSRKISRTPAKRSGTRP